jgi:uncharacterized protein (TIGR02466 family)
MMIEQHWPTAVGKFNMDWTDSELSELIEELYTIEQNEIDAGKDLRQFSMSGKGYHTKANLFCGESILLQKLRITIEDEFNKYSTLTTGRILPPFAYTRAWAMIYRGGMSKPHVHPGAMLSGVVYLKIPKNDNHSGEFCIMDPRPAANFAPDEYEGSEQCINAETGKGIIFPSWLPHFVTQTNSDEERISISVNLFIPPSPADATYIERELKMS